jgi:8-oxo-dGTP pyrophosphatase MutT (NUDIX family)
VIFEQAGGVVVKLDGGDVRFLLVTSKREPSRWVWPKGHIDSPESAEEAAVREVREEAGVVARVRASLGSVNVAIRGADRNIQFFLMDYVGDVPPDDARGVAWCTYDDAWERLMFPESCEILARARKALDNGKGESRV